MRIPPETIRTVQQTADIVEVVNDFVALKKRGANYMACCPFHNEKTPSFNVNPARGIYKCFGCGKAGDSVRFVMDIENISFPEAIKYLAKKYNIEIQETEPTNEELAAQNERESLYIVLNFAKKFFQEQLLQSDEGQGIGLSYFKERGFRDKTIADFELGYSLNAWDGLTQAAQKAGFSIDILEKAGLSIRKEENNKVFDRFRARVTFPIHNLSGKVIAFGARILTKDKTQAKYLNSPETEVYHKSNILYGIFQAKQSIRQEDVCYLVEGYTDVISLHQAGIKNVVASSGTSLTLEQIRLISRFTPNITMLYDGDVAGIKASLRGTDLILEEGLNVKVVVFPDSEDPDSYVQKVGGEAFQTYINTQAKDFITFKAELNIQEAGTDPFKRAEIIRDMVESIAKIPDSIKRSVFFQQTAQLMNIDEGILIAEANKIYLKAKTTKQRPETPPAANTLGQQLPEGVALPSFEEGEEWGTMPPTPLVEAPLLPTIRKTAIEQHEEQCVSLLVRYGSKFLEPGITLTDYVLDELRDLDFETPLYQLFLQKIRDALANGTDVETQDFLADDNEAIRQATINLISAPHTLSENWQKMYQIYVPTDEDKLADAAFTNILRLKKAYNEKKMLEVKNQLKMASTATEQDELLGLWMRMKEIDKTISTELGMVVNK